VTCNRQRFYPSLRVRRVNALSPVLAGATKNGTRELFFPAPASSRSQASSSWPNHPERDIQGIPKGRTKLCGTASLTARRRPLNPRTLCNNITSRLRSSKLRILAIRSVTSPAWRFFDASLVLLNSSNAQPMCSPIVFLDASRVWAIPTPNLLDTLDQVERLLRSPLTVPVLQQNLPVSFDELDNLPPDCAGQFTHDLRWNSELH